MKKTCIVFQVILLIWFFLDMTGFSFGNKCLVTQSYKEDGIFFLIYLIAVVLFIIKEKIGKLAVAVWTSMWFIIQFLCHEWYTILGSGIMGSTEGKIRYFSDTIKLLEIPGKYIPDLYHTVLHVMILAVVITSFVFIKTSRPKKR